MSKVLDLFKRRVAGPTSAEHAAIDNALKAGATKLDLSNLGIASLPSSFDQLTQTKELYLSGNKLIALPKSIVKFSQLEILRLDSNLLSDLPEGLGQLKQLRVLDLSHNQLKILPSELGELNQLLSLYLAGNILTELPESFGDLVQLQRLDLSNNRLTDLPLTMSNLKALTKLFLHDNIELDIPAEILGPSADDFGLGRSPVSAVGILDYYFRSRADKRPLNEAKLVLVGRGGVGKTSIVNRLVDDVFQPEKKTEGIKIREWRIELNEQVRFNVWDFGGQEIQHATHQFFLTQRSLYLLVLNGREGLEDPDAEYWLKLIESFGGSSPVIVVLNKIKEHPFDLNRRALLQKHAIREFVQTDCKDGTGINELQEAIRRETDRLEDLRKAFPSRWFAIKDRLAGMTENYLSFERYRRICEEHGETDEKAQEDLARFLHQLGIVLNYRSDPRLKDTHVLSPHWVTTGIYRILNSDKLQKQQGRICLSDLSEILDADEYPVGMHRFIFDLMRKFELCFTFPDDDMQYLVPELLDKQEPGEADEFNEKESLRFQYHYPVLPEGLLPRFIVRTHVLSEGQPLWRTGVIMEFEGCRALVKADLPERKVYISVTGPSSSRRRLLAVIRSDFERIHGDIRHLLPQEMVAIPNHPDVVIPYQKLLAMERHRIWKFHEYVKDRLIEVNVKELLNGVDPEGALDRKGSAPRQKKTSVFISYSHKDEALRNELETHLKILQRQDSIDVWQDRKIEAGDDWKTSIDDHLERAHIILLLISADFLASDYCYELEARRALERSQKGTARVIPVILRPCNWQIAEFATLQALPRDGFPVTKWRDKDSAWLSVEQGIGQVVKELRKESVI